MASPVPFFLPNCIPPSLYIINLQGVCVHSGTNEARFVFPSFFTALKSIEDQSYTLEGAIYTPDGASIFIATENKDCLIEMESKEEPEDFANILETITTNRSTASTPGTQVVVFNGYPTKVTKSSSGPIEAKALSASFTTVCQSLYAKRYVVQGATLAPEGGRIFINTEDEMWQTYIKF